MAGHGSPPAENKANHPGRQVGRPEGGWGRDANGMIQGKVSGPGPNDVGPLPGARKPYGQGGPHPSLSNEAVERVRQQTAQNSAWKMQDPDFIEEGRRLNAEPRDDSDW